MVQIPSAEELASSSTIVVPGMPGNSAKAAPRRKTTSSTSLDQSYDGVDDLLGGAGPGKTQSSATTSPWRGTPSPSGAERVGARWTSDRRWYVRAWRVGMLAFLAGSTGALFALWVFGPMILERKLTRQEASRPQIVEAAKGDRTESEPGPSLNADIARLDRVPALEAEPSQEAAKAAVVIARKPALEVPIGPSDEAGAMATLAGPSGPPRVRGWIAPRDPAEAHIQRWDALLGIERPAVKRVKLTIRKTPPREQHPEARLAQPISDLRRGPEPLASFLRFAADLSGTPLTIDAEALRRSAVTPHTPVAVQLERGTLGEALDLPLRKLNLGYRVTRHDVVIDQSRRSATSQITNLDLTDLVGDGLAIEQLQHAVDLVDGLDFPETPSLGGVLRIRGAPFACEDARRLVDRIRAARGLPPTSNELDPVCPFAWHQDAGVAMLAQPVFVSAKREFPLVVLFRELERQADGCLLVDWPAIRELGMSDTSIAKVRGERAALGLWLKESLPEHGLTFRVVSDRALEVTSISREARREVLELHRWSPATNPPLGLLSRQAELHARITSACGRLGVPVPNLDRIVPLDPDGDCWLACLPQSHQLLLARILNGESVSDPRASAIESA